MDNLSAKPDTSTGPIDQRFMRFSERLNTLNAKRLREEKAPLFEEDADPSKVVSASAGLRREVAVLKEDLQHVFTFLDWSWYQSYTQSRSPQGKGDKS